MKKISRQEFLKWVSSAAASVFFQGKGGSASTGQLGTFLAEKSDDFSSPVELGRSRIKVTPMGFGASRTMEPALVQAALDGGLNFVDTGRSYFRGQNEGMVGKVIAERRKEVILQTRLRVNLAEKELASGQKIAEALKEMTASLEASLKALQTDYVDILLIHGAESPAVIHQPEVIDFFKVAKKKGQIRASGFSCHANQVEMLREAHEKLAYDVVMLPYNPTGGYIHMNTGRKSSWDQDALEREMVRAREKGLGLVAMKTCSGGPFSVSPGVKPSYPGALRWILERGLVHTMAVAMASFDQIKENLDALRGDGPDISGSNDRRVAPSGRWR